MTLIFVTIGDTTPFAGTNMQQMWDERAATIAPSGYTRLTAGSLAVAAQRVQALVAQHLVFDTVYFLGHGFHTGYGFAAFRSGASVQTPSTALLRVDAVDAPGVAFFGALASVLAPQSNGSAPPVITFECCELGSTPNLQNARNAVGRASVVRGYPTHIDWAAAPRTPNAPRRGPRRWVVHTGSNGLQSVGP